MKKPKVKMQPSALKNPDITQMVAVTTGDTLPALAQRIDDNNTFYVQPAEYGGLNKLRAVQPGETLTFPPLSSSAE